MMMDKGLEYLNNTNSVSKINRPAEPRYNGWENYETWNVVLWLQNDFILYSIAKHFTDYDQFIIKGLPATKHPKQTPDGVKWNDAKISKPEVNGMLMEWLDDNH